MDICSLNQFIAMFLCSLDPAPEVKNSVLTTICYDSEPWKNPYMLFMLPGFIIWIIGAIWCFRKNNICGSVVLQVLGALEIAIGGAMAFILAMKSVASVVFTAGGFDPSSAAMDFIYYSEIPIIGLIAHFILLAITLIIASRARRNLKKIQPVS